MKGQQLIQWLLDGDVSIQYQVYRDLLGEDRPDLQERIAQEGWGAQFLSYQKPESHWGRGFYQPKWISSHYTILDLKNLAIAPDHPRIRTAIQFILDHHISEDGGLNPHRELKQSDVCINGMGLNYATYFGMPEQQLHSIVDFILSQRMPDGGFNCRLNRSGARHSSLHSTISVLEGIQEYAMNGYHYRLEELQEAQQTGEAFILLHQLYISDRTGEIIKKEFLRLSYPSRWKYDILRALSYFCLAQKPYDPRMQPAIEVLLKKRRKDGTWPVQAKHPGQTHFDMEQAGQPSRWNTLRALRVLKWLKEQGKVGRE